MGSEPGVGLAIGELEKERWTDDIAMIDVEHIDFIAAARDETAVLFVDHPKLCVARRSCCWDPR